MQKRQLLFPAVLATAVIAMTGCDLVHSALIDIGSKGENSMTRTFVAMSGTRWESISIPEGETPEIRFQLTLDKGQFEVVVADNKGTELYQKSAETSETFAVSLEDSGSYQLTLKSEDASGNYEISWGDPPPVESGEGGTK